MTAVDPEGRIRHPLDVFHSTLEPDGDFVPAGYVPMADGLGQVEYVDSATIGGGGGSLAGLSDVTVTTPQENDTLRYRSGQWVNDNRRWEPVTFDPGTGPEIVFTATDIVMTWETY